MTHDEVGLDPLSEKFHQVEEVDYVVSLTTEIPDGILGYQVGGFGGPFIGLCLSLRSVFGKYPWTLMKMFRPWVHDGVPTSIRFSNHSLKCVDVRNTRGEQLHFLDFKTAYQLAVDGFRMARWKISRCNAYQLGFNKYHNAHFALTQAIVAAVKTIASSSRFCKSKEAKEVRQDLHEALKENLAEDHLLAIVDALQETEGAKVG